MSEPVRLNVNLDADLDWLMAYEFGRADDGQHPDQWHGLNEQFGFLLDAPEGRIIGSSAWKPATRWRTAA